MGTGLEEFKIFDMAERWIKLAESYGLGERISDSPSTPRKRLVVAWPLVAVTGDPREARREAAAEDEIRMAPTSPVNAGCSLAATRRASWSWDGQSNADRSDLVC